MFLVSISLILLRFLCHFEVFKILLHITFGGVWKSGASLRGYVHSAARKFSDFRNFFKGTRVVWKVSDLNMKMAALVNESYWM